MTARPDLAAHATIADTPTVLKREEWERRYAARLMERGGLEERLAIQCGKDAAAECERWERAAGNAVDWANPADNPEDAADEEMSYWEDDGE